MKNEFSRLRRFAVAVFALSCASVLFRTQVADALVIRGDEYMYRGDRIAALERYKRALTIAPGLEVAADRYVFVSLERQTPSSLRAAIAVADRYLRRHPSDAAVLSDRALCYLHLQRYGLAQQDFERAAKATHEANDYVFAGWAAARAGHLRQADGLWREALRVHPGYRPAMAALSERRG